MVTRQLTEAVTMGIEVLDHIVVGDVHRYYSFKEVGTLESGSMGRSTAA